MWGQMKPARRQTTPRTPETSEGNQPSDEMCRPMHSPALPVVPTCVKGIPTFFKTTGGGGGGGGGRSAFGAGVVGGSRSNPGAGILPFAGGGANAGAPSAGGGGFGGGGG